MSAYMDLVSVSRLQRNPTVKSEIQMRNFEASIPVGFLPSVPGKRRQAALSGNRISGSTNVSP